MKSSISVALGAALAISAALATGTSMAASVEPSTSGTASPSPSTTSTTTNITLSVRGCEGCTIAVQRGLTNEPASTVTPAQPDNWQGPKAKVRHGKVTLTLPTAYTPGSSFTVSAPWEGNTDGITNIVLGGAYPTGTTLTVSQATERKKATACWAGTTESQASISVKVIRRTLGGVTNKPVVFPIAWASPTVATVGPLSPTLGKGLLGNQDMYFC